jgi:hypothetical protein
MTEPAGPKPRADVTIEPSLVRALLLEQHADLAHLPLNDVGEGWDNNWMLLPPPARRAFVTSARGASDPLDEHTLLRARGWALALGLAYLAHSRDDEAMRALGRATLDNALACGVPPE